MAWSHVKYLFVFLLRLNLEVVSLKTVFLRKHKKNQRLIDGERSIKLKKLKFLTTFREIFSPLQVVNLFEQYWKQEKVPIFQTTPLWLWITLQLINLDSPDYPRWFHEVEFKFFIVSLNLLLFRWQWKFSHTRFFALESTWIF